MHYGTLCDHANINDILDKFVIFEEVNGIWVTIEDDGILAVTSILAVSSSRTSE